MLFAEASPARISHGAPVQRGHHQAERSGLMRALDARLIGELRPAFVIVETVYQTCVIG